MMMGFELGLSWGWMRGGGGGFEGKFAEEEGFEADCWEELKKDVGGVGKFAGGGEGDLLVVGEGGEFAGVGAAEFEGGAGEESHDAGAGEALEVEDVVVVGFPDIFEKVDEGFGAFFSLKEEGVVDGVAEGDDGGEAVADDPVDEGVGELFFDGLGDLEGEDDVAEGGWFDD